MEEDHRTAGARPRRGRSCGLRRLGAATRIAVVGGAGGGSTGGTLIIGTDLPLQGASADASADTNLAIKLLLKKVASKAGN